MTKSQLPRSMNQIKKHSGNVIKSDKNEFWSKKFFLKKNFFLKNSKSNIPPPPWISPKNTSIPTENGKTVQFHALKHLFLSSAPWKTTKNTYISIIRQIWKNSPETGCFLALNVPGGTRTRILPRSVTVVLYLVQLPPHFDRVSEKKWMDQMLWGEKCHFNHFGAF